MKRIGILTSGGDAPGMNAAVRAVARKALSSGLEVCGIQYGYRGLVEGDFFEIKEKEVSDLIQVGGTFLYSARYPEFAQAEVQLKGVEQLKKHGIDALVVVGGDGSYHGALRLTEHGFNAVGLPGTIDNDIPYTDFTIGFDTAVNTSIEAIDKLRDTAKSHCRTFIVEVMGRNAGDIALYAGVASGAQAVVVPEEPIDVDEIANILKDSRKRGHQHAIVVTAEGAMKAEDLLTALEQRGIDELRATVLGHIARGGSPSMQDRVLASRMGAYAVDLLLAGKGGLAVGIQNNKITHHDMLDLFDSKHEPALSLYGLAKDLAY